ncbi:MFS transporter [Kineosporia sp. J2-2]|uniref:MFS transporter n=1 Tax=Kineosporia corallincola TaxID=2835133 RepID=A0ABS5TN93_9ACTN|nr:MFS transporter [Kineosporia corallincola]MBT0772563.1 MFS transporter [Kineosporia corallincola]
MFRSLGVRNFRLFAGGQVLSALGTWMMVVCQDWLVLRLTGGSAAALSTVTALQFTPLALFMLPGGRLADRYDKRTLLIVANAVSAGWCAVLAGLDLSGSIRLWHVYLVAAGLGLVNAVEMPTRMAFVSELVGPELLPNASALSAAYFNLSRVTGTALVGLLISTVGTGPVMALNAVSYAATIAGLALIRRSELLLGARPAGRGGVVDGLRYVAGRSDLVAAVGLLAVVALVTFNFQVTLPLLATQVLHADATAFGLVSTAFAAGSLASALATTLRRRRPSGTLLVASALVLGLMEVAVGLAGGTVVLMLLLFALGFASLFFGQAANHRIQLGSDPAYRGRVLALYSLIMQGSTPLGALLVGWTAGLWGVRSSFLLAGVITALAAVLWWFPLVKHPAATGPDPGGSRVVVSRSRSRG